MTISNLIYWCFYWCSFSAPVLSLGLLAREPATRSHPPSEVSLVGRWKTFDDATGKAQSIVNTAKTRTQFPAQSSAYSTRIPDIPFRDARAAQVN